MVSCNIWTYLLGGGVASAVWIALVGFVFYSPPQKKNRSEL